MKQILSKAFCYLKNWPQCTANKKFKYFFSSSFKTIESSFLLLHPYKTHTHFLPHKLAHTLTHAFHNSSLLTSPRKFSLSVFLSVCPVSHTHTQKNKNTDCCEQNFKPKFYNQFRCNANKINFSKFQFKFGFWCIKIYSNILTKF